IVLLLIALEITIISAEEFSEDAETFQDGSKNSSSKQSHSILKQSCPSVCQPGRDGRDGHPGHPGHPGHDGRDGCPGAPGPQGPIGVQGTTWERWNEGRSRCPGKSFQSIS
uniref:Cnidarian restricted protein n=1 Tax=Clytia hemisphaerica TaxID=252671 RepID=A0A7M5XLX6_9CNID